MLHPDFNPRSDERSDYWDTMLAAYCIDISIHAPTNGATLSVLDRLALFIISIHAPTNGATIKWDNDAKTLVISIHAPTNGAT